MFTDAVTLLALPFAASLLLVAIHTYLGIQVLARGVIFVDLALAQVAALGATVAFMLGHAVASAATFGYSLAFTFAAALVLASTRAWSARIPQEALIGVLYVVAAAAAFLLVDKAPQGTEHIRQILTGNILTAQQTKDWQSGKLDFIAVIAEDRVSAAERGAFSEFSPGEHFVYKNTDPLVLGLMIGAATGVSYAEWVQRTIFDPAGVQGPGWISQNPRGQAHADGGLRLRMEDWARLAWWVKQSSGQPDCFGGYLRDASRTQIARKPARVFAGYGFLIWTDNTTAPDTYWALGYGGQRIAWSHRNDRMLIAFSNVEDWMADLYALFRDWSALR